MRGLSRNKLFRGILYLSATYVIVALTVAFAQFVTKPRPTPTPVNTASTTNLETCQPDVQQLIALINQERSKVGAPTLSIDSALATSAHNKLSDEIGGQYYGHNLLDGRSWSIFARNQGVKAALSEDLDENALNPTEDWAAFRDSPAHYSSLTDPQYTRIGVAEQCTDFTLKTGTGPDDNTSLVGQTIKELTVVHLAAPEPPAQAAPTRQVTVCSPPPANSNIDFTVCSTQ